MEEMLESAGIDFWYKNKDSGDHLYLYELQFIYEYDGTETWEPKRPRTKKPSVMVTFGISTHANRAAFEAPYAYMRGSPHGLAEAVEFVEKWFRSIGTSTSAHASDSGACDHLPIPILGASLGSPSD